MATTTNETISINLDVKTDNSMKSLKDMRLEIKLLTDQMSAAGAAGDKATFDKLKMAIGELKNDMRDLTVNMKAADPGELLSNFIKLGQGAVGAFAGITGAMSLFGDKSEAIQEIEKKANVLIQTMIGLEQARALLIDKGNIAKMKGMLLSIKTQYQEITATWDAYTAKKAETAATEGATVAQWLWNAAMNANPIGLAVAAIVALVAGVYALTVAFDDSSDAVVNNYNNMDIMSESTRKLQNELYLLNLELQFQKGLISEAELTAAKNHFNQLAEIEAAYAKNRNERVSLQLTIDEQNRAYEKDHTAKQGVEILNIRYAAMQKLAKLEEENRKQQSIIDKKWADQNEIDVDKAGKKAISEAEKKSKENADRVKANQDKVTQLTNEAEQKRIDNMEKGLSQEIAQLTLNNKIAKEKYADKEKDTTEIKLLNETNRIRLDEKFKIDKDNANKKANTEDFNTYVKKLEDENKLNVGFKKDEMDLEIQFLKDKKEAVDKYPNVDIFTGAKMEDIEAAAKDIERIKFNHIGKMMDLKTKYEKEYLDGIKSTSETQQELIDNEKLNYIENEDEKLQIKIKSIKKEQNLIIEEFNKNTEERSKLNDTQYKSEYDALIKQGLSAEEFKKKENELNAKWGEINKKEFEKQNEFKVSVEKSTNQQIEDATNESYIKRLEDFLAFNNQIGSIISELKQAEQDNLDARQERETTQFEEAQSAQTQSIIDEYDNRIRAAQLAGQSTVELEKQKNTKLDNLNKEQALKDKQLKEKQAKEDKELKKKYALIELTQQIAEIGTNTALAIMKVAGQLGIFSIPAQIAMGVLGAVQVGVAVDKYNQIQKLALGGIANGPSHAQGGINIGGGQEIEGGEGIINKRSMMNPALRSIASAVNVAGGGISFDNGVSGTSLSATIDSATIEDIVQRVTDRIPYIIDVRVSEEDITSTQKKVKVIQDRNIIG